MKITKITHVAEIKVLKPIYFNGFIVTPRIIKEGDFLFWNMDFVNMLKDRKDLAKITCSFKKKYKFNTIDELRQLTATKQAEYMSSLLVLPNNLDDDEEIEYADDLNDYYEEISSDKEIADGVKNKISECLNILNSIDDEEKVETIEIVEENVKTFTEQELCDISRMNFPAAKKFVGQRIDVTECKTKREVLAKIGL